MAADELTLRLVDTVEALAGEVEALREQLTDLRERAILPENGDCWFGRFKYSSGSIVNFHGRFFVARRSTQGEPPDGKAGAWEPLRAVDDSAHAAEVAAPPPLRVAS